MTEAAKTPPLQFTTIAEVIDTLRKRGMRLSTARRLVLEALFAAEGPVSAPQLAAQLAIDTTSVYRNLELLEQAGVVRHVHLAHGAGLYALADGAEREYLYCERCGSVTAVDVTTLDPVRQLIREQFGFDAQFTHFAIVGSCAPCAQHVSAEVPPAHSHT